MYKEPFLLPTESLTVGLGDTRKISVSNGLHERTEGPGVFVISAREDIRAQPGDFRATFLSLSETSL